jgi:prepilin-type N-terminal cleavage/methylation domain-containing protein
MENHIEEVQAEKKDKGFTLVELLIVIVILGILATVTVFAVRGITDQGQTSACQADQKTLETAVETYFAQEGGTIIPMADPDGAGGPLPSTAEGALVTAGFLRSASSNFTVDTNGALVIQNTACTLI